MHQKTIRGRLCFSDRELWQGNEHCVDSYWSGAEGESSVFLDDSSFDLPYIAGPFATNGIADIVADAYNAGHLHRGTEFTHTMPEAGEYTYEITCAKPQAGVTHVCTGSNIRTVIKLVKEWNDQHLPYASVLDDIMECDEPDTEEHDAGTSYGYTSPTSTRSKKVHGRSDSDYFRINNLMQQVQELTMDKDELLAVERRKSTKEINKQKREIAKLEKENSVLKNTIKGLSAGRGTPRIKIRANKQRTITVKV